MKQDLWSVAKLVSYIKRGIDHDDNLTDLFVQGEVSNLTKHRSGHYYFTLKDDLSRMNCVMFSNFARLVNFDLKDGSKVIAHCKVSVYEPSGAVQLYIKGLQMDGLGDLYQQFEKLKHKLNDEGYFDPAHKKPIPKYPENIAIISANKAAALSDVMTTLTKRWPLAKTTLYPSLVQGENASRQLIEMIQKADQNGHDVILLVRGGGSIEDLWAFNNEDLAKCIYHTKTPLISGVGHEVDVTLVDYVSDLRAATPTAAAQLATPDIQDVRILLKQKKKQIIQIMQSRIESNELSFHRYQNHPYLRNPESFIENKMITLDIKKSGLDSFVQKTLQQTNETRFKRQQLFHEINNRLMIHKMDISLHQSRLMDAKNIMIEVNQSEFKRKIAMLDALSPLKVLQRGYSVTIHEEKMIQSVDDIREKDTIKTIVMDGYIESTVIKRSKNHE